MSFFQANPESWASLLLEHVLRLKTSLTGNTDCEIVMQSHCESA